MSKCLVAWKSFGQKSVSLSSSEAEYDAVSDVSTEILFIKSILTVSCDSAGAIFLEYVHQKIRAPNGYPNPNDEW